MSLLIPTNLSGSGPKGKTRFEANNPGVNVASSSDQANINDSVGKNTTPRNIDQSTETKIQSDAFQQAPSKAHQMDDPWSERDEYGAELTKDARVWKVYVKEADKSDTELVDGWNKSLDAALFSAVSTAFLIESSKMLKQDPNDVSAAALVVMSRALVALTSNSSVDLSSLSMPDQSPSSPFVPAHNAVLINTLWYLSLATSVATSFLAMLAKDWCRSFETGRSGHPYDQAQRRQRKWMMIERWKMQELIVVLPSLIHISLLLFAIGLCIYVWDLDVTTAIPVMCVCGAAFTFYLGSSVVASIVEYFPYTTIVSRIVRSESFGNIMKKISKLPMFISLSARWISRSAGSILLSFAGDFLLAVFLSWIWINALRERTLSELYIDCATAFKNILDRVGSYSDWILILNCYINKLEGMGRSWASYVTSTFRSISHLTGNSFGHCSPNQVTSHCLHWLIQDCETPSSTAVALQAIAGAASNIPLDPLKDCDASFKILQRLVSGGSGPTAAYDASLYARALSALTTLSQFNSEKASTSTEDLAVMIWNLKLQYEHNLTVMIGNGEFVATKKNLEALQTGNSASSYAIRLLQGSHLDAKKTMASMMTLLKSNADSSYQQLHPAAVRSLANGAALLEACSDAPLLSGSDVEHLIITYQTYIREHRYSTRHNIVRSTEVALMPLVDALMHRYMMKRTAISNASVSDSASVYLLQALRRSADKGQQDVSCLVQLYWLWCTEITTNPAQCGLDPSSPELTRLKAWCSLYLSKSDPVQTEEITAFLSAINRVYGSAAPSDTDPICLPPAVYVIVVFAVLWPQSNKQRVTAMNLLSKCSFPTLKAELIQYLTRIGCNFSDNLSYHLGNRQGLRASDNPVHQHFCATQLWILLHLVHDPTTETQQKLKDLLESESLLEIKSRGIDQVKKDLESRIIAYYQAERLDTYSARIIECIHQARDTQPDSKLASLIEQKLKDVPPCHRGLKQFSHSLEATLAPVDPALTSPSSVSRSTPSVSVSGVLEGLQEPEQRCDVDHVSISITPYVAGLENNYASSCV
ncbi:hypothetical protein RHS04_09006 [Rhizoctonia solani]|uniref:DUF6535 domain-containing protein n=1 Tax=Rhizoctonia solani TaxID=456999 RepID=A0A8H7LG10_9AGAM|nr:hypothetical protein RHS04_09006 [Rhizoctonia solani]